MRVASMTATIGRYKESEAEMTLDLDVFKRQLQAHFSDGLVTVVGSGLSCAEGLPGMGLLGTHLASTVGSRVTGADAIAWAGIAADLGSIGLEAALHKHVLSSAAEEIVVSETAALILMHEKRVIQDVFNGKRTLRLTRLIPHMLKTASGMPFVTTNYDRLVEVAIEEADIGVDTMFVGSFAGKLNVKESQFAFCRGVRLRNKTASLDYRPRAIVLKPHGSLDWYGRQGNPVSYGGELDDVRRLIITPGKNKFRFGYDSPFDTHRERANRAIDQAQRFLIVGYGFNDDHLETHLTPAIKSGRPTLLLTHSLSPAARALASTHANVIGLEYHQSGNEAGTRVYVDKAVHFVSNINLWDLNSFVSETFQS